MPRTEFQNVKDFTNILGIQNKTDGTLFLYKKPITSECVALKPDGYYFKDGVTFILDAKAENKNFSGQLEDYMKLEPNKNFIGFKYSFNQFKCFVKGKLIESERELKNYKILTRWKKLANLKNFLRKKLSN